MIFEGLLIFSRLDLIYNLYLYREDLGNEKNIVEWKLLAKGRYPLIAQLRNPPNFVSVGQFFGFKFFWVCSS